jgi:hypothetical protein
MQVVQHQNVGVKAKVKGLLQVSKQAKIFGSVLIIVENLLPLIAAGNHMVESPWIFHSWSARHSCLLLS